MWKLTHELLLFVCVIVMVRVSLCVLCVFLVRRRRRNQNQKKRQRKQGGGGDGRWPKNWPVMQVEIVSKTSKPSFFVQYSTIAITVSDFIVTMISATKREDSGSHQTAAQTQRIILIGQKAQGSCPSKVSYVGVK